MEKAGEYQRPEYKDYEEAISTDTVLMEITSRCYVGCNDCYKGELVSPKGAHVEKDTVIRRLHWIHDHTEASMVMLIGGEPLLHPDFQEIVTSAQGLGLSVELISAGQVSNLPVEQANYAFMLQQIEDGKMTVELSYQPGRNERAFKRTYKDILDRVGKRREKVRNNLKYMKRVDPEKFRRSIKVAEKELRRNALFSTVTIPSAYQGDPEKFKEIYKFLMDIADIDVKKISFGKEREPALKHFESQFGQFGQHFSEQGQNPRYMEHLSYKEQTGQRKNRITARIWGPVRFTTDENGHFSEVLTSMGTEKNDALCPAMPTYFYATFDQVRMETPTIRTDGELMFSTPACIASPVGFLNVDTVTDEKEIYQRLKVNIQAVQMSNMNAMRAKAELTKAGKLGYCKIDSEYPEEDGKNLVCPSCPFNISCNACFSRTKEDREGYFAALKEV